MMKNIYIFIVTALISSNVTFSQSLKHNLIKFEESPRIHKVADSLAGESAIIIKDNRYIQLYKGFQNYSTYYTIHKIVKVNDDAGIEKFNKVYIPFYNTDKLERIEVRAISKANTVKKFNKENLKELENIEGYGNYKIFAVEGLEIGGELEYKYTIKRNPRTYGREVFQREVPTLNARFELLYPIGIPFKVKSYNGFPEKDSQTNGFVINAENIPALPEEAYSSYKSKLMRVDYKLGNTYMQSSKLNWNDISMNILKSIYTNSGWVQSKKLIKELNLDGKSTVEKIKTLEKEIKNRFSITKSNKEEYSVIKDVFKNKVGNEEGILKVYIKCFEQLKLNFEVVCTRSRFNGTIDEDFAHYMDLTDVLFYFPDSKKFICPGHNYMRFGPATNVFAGNSALFIKTYYDKDYNRVAYNGFRIENIDFMPASENNKGVKAEISLNKNFDEATIKQKNYFQGYDAFIFRYLYNTGDEEVIEDFKRNRLASAIDDVKFISFDVENSDMDLSSDNVKNCIFKSEYSSKSLVEKIGGDVVLSIGKVIGEQVEMYEEKDRVTDVIFFNTRLYNHELKINIPDGYKCKGLEQLKIDNSLVLDEKVVIEFKSDYEIVDGQLIISIRESYDVIELDKKYYNDYRRVVNSAADFNKINLIFEAI